MSFGGFQRFSSMIILHISHLSFLHFETPCLVCFQNLNEWNVCFEFFGCCLLSMIFVMSNMFLVLSLFSF